MKLLFLSSILCVCFLYSNAQLSLPDTLSDQTNIVNSPGGNFTGYHANGDKRYEGYKRKDVLHGPWSSWYNNGQQVDAGSLQKGIPNGQWSGWYQNGQLHFIKTYSADKWQQFQYEKGHYHPKRVSMYITKLFHEHKKQAAIYTTAINSFCDKQNCARVNEALQQTISNNTIQEHYHPVFDQGLLHGPFAIYFPDGAIKDTGNYKNGLPEGLWIKWTDDKQFYWHGHYVHGKKNKEWKLYSSADKLIRILYFKNGTYLWRKDMKEGIETTQEELSGF
jgi:antitoxin component YwqK of YwqJK toxin-antitoxin module